MFFPSIFSYSFKEKYFILIDLDFCCCFCFVIFHIQSMQSSLCFLVCIRYIRKGKQLICHVLHKAKIKLKLEAIES